MFRLIRSATLSLLVLFAGAGLARANDVFTAGGNLKFTDPRDAQGKHFHVHDLWLEAGHTYVFNMNSMHFDTFLRLKSPAGFVVAQNDDGGPALNSRIVFRPMTSGKYRLVATSFAPGATGSYSVRVGRDGGVLLNVHGDLKFSDPLHFGKHTNSYKLFLRAGETYVLDLSSPHFDTFLRITTQGGMLVAQNDDGGPGLNSRLVFRPTVSRFYNIVVTSYAPAATGHYHLTVRD